MISATERFLAVLNRVTGYDFTLSDITIGDALPNTVTEIKRNSVITVTATRTGKAKGRMTFYYDRLNFNDMFAGITAEIPVSLEDALTTQDIAEALATRYGIELDRTDVVSSGSFHFTELPTTVRITAVEGNRAWSGWLDVSLRESPTDVVDSLAITDLNGLNPPSGDLTKSQATIYSWEFEATTPEDVSTLVGLAAEASAEPLLDMVRRISGDNWVSQVGSAPYNLHGAVVFYNGNNVDADVRARVSGNPDHPMVLSIELSAECNNIGGLLNIGYSS